MGTVADLVKSSMRLIGAIGTGETPSANELADGISTLNDILESWSNDGLLIHSRTREVFPLIPSQSRYSIGTGGDFNTSRPQQIQEASILVNDYELPVEIINVQEFAALSIKSSTSTIPTKLYCEGTYPLDFINLFDVPSAANSLVIYSLKPLAKYTLGSDVISLPPGYQRALRYNLGLELSPEYGRPLSELIISVAQESKSEIKRKNTTPVYMTSDVFGMTERNSYNYETGE